MAIKIDNNVTTIAGIREKTYNNAKYIGLSGDYEVLTRGANGEITSCAISANATYILKDAFKDISSLTSITIPEGVTSIGESAFEGTGITSITIPSSVGKIGKAAFKDCTSLQTVTFLGGYLQSLSEEIFSGCTSLTTITLPATIETIDKNAFMNCTSLATLTLPQDITSIGVAVLKGCSVLTNLTIPFIGRNADSTSYPRYPLGYLFGEDSYTGGTGVSQDFYATSNGTWYIRYFIPSSLRTVTILDGEIPRGAFYSCEMLTAINLPENATSIGQNAFFNCMGITSLTIPSGIATFASNNFYGCSNLANVYFDGDITTLATFTCSSNDYALLKGRALYHNNQLVTEIEYPTTLAQYATSIIYGCTSITRVIYKGTDSTISFIDMFPNLTCLDSSLSSSIYSTTIEELHLKAEGSFSTYLSSCSSLSTIVFEEGITELQANLPSSITTIELPSTLTSLNLSFGSSPTITLVKYNGTIKDWCHITFSNSSSNPLSKLSTSGHFYIGEDDITEVIIPEDTEYVNNYAFAYFKLATKFVLPEGITYQNYSFVFSDAPITYAEIPVSALKEESAWNSYSSSYNTATKFSIQKETLLELKVHSTGSLPYSCFRDFKYLESLTLGDGITTMLDRSGFNDSSTFRGCESLETIKLPANIDRIGHHSFEGCSSLTSLEIPNSVETIGVYAFSGCTGLTSLTIPDSVTTINDSAFIGCSGLEELTIPFLGNNENSTDTGFGRLTSAWLFGSYSSSTTGVKTINYDINNSSNKIYTIYPSNLETIRIHRGNTGYHAFQEFSSLKYIYLGDDNSNIELGNCLFTNCTSLLQIHLGRYAKTNYATFYKNSSSWSFASDSAKIYFDYSLLDLTKGTALSQNLAYGIGNIYTYDESTDSYITIQNRDLTIQVGDRDPIGGKHTSGVIRNLYYLDNYDTFWEHQFTSGFYAESLYVGGHLITEVKLPYYHTDIPDYKFTGVGSITSPITILTDDITKIGKNPFSGLSVSVSVPSTFTKLQYIGDRALYSISASNDFKLELVNDCSLEDCGLYANSYLTECTGTFNTIETGKEIFYSCQNLVKLHATINGPIGQNALYGCNALSDVKLKGIVTSIAKDAFRAVGKNRTDPYLHILDFDFRNGTFTELPIAFANSSSEYSSYFRLFLPSTLTSTVMYALRYNQNFSVYMRGNTPASLGYGTFNSCTGYKIFVPYNKIDTYKNASSNWSSSASYIYGWAEENTFELNDILPATNDESLNLTWYDDEALTNAVSTVDDPTKIYYCTVSA